MSENTYAPPVVGDWPKSGKGLGPQPLPGVRYSWRRPDDAEKGAPFTVIDETAPVPAKAWENMLFEETGERPPIDLRPGAISYGPNLRRIHALPFAELRRERLVDDSVRACVDFTKARLDKFGFLTVRDLDVDAVRAEFARRAAL